MAVLKCKMCGGDLNAAGGEKVVECEFCGTTQTVPDGNDEKKTNLFNRANKLRIVGEFDKAAGIYESITAEFPDDAESYWGLCLCKFGIEYVDDPKTAKKIPTCHRTSFESIFDDENYKAAIDKSDVIAQDVYKNEAAEIDRLQKDILSVVHREEPFDVFICYKETDDLGARTPDSVLAQDIYTELTNQGLKVFFARITLEDKLGKEYEPYIFAALNSAKVMLAIGTKEEYFNSVWVKNEWNRYLALMQSDKSKTLIPCYRDMDAYDIPQEFKNLQGQDMSKLGFLQDLVRGVCKIINPEQSSGHETSAQTLANSTVDTLLKRVFMFLEDKNWQSANEYCEKVLDIDPENSEAYLGKLMAELNVKNVSEIEFVSSAHEQIIQNLNYKKFMQFAPKERANEITAYISSSLFKETKITLPALETDNNILDELSVYNDVYELIKICSKKLAWLIKKMHQMQKELRPSDIIFAVGLRHFVALQSYGTVVACGDNYKGQCNVSDWTDIIAVSAGGYHTVGLKADGTVVACGDNSSGQCDVSYWADIIAVSAGSQHTVGLKADGTVVACGDNSHGQCDVSYWADIVAISAGGNTTAGLISKGTVISSHRLNGVTSLEGIVAISASNTLIAGLTMDGRVVFAGSASNSDLLSYWENIVAISAGITHNILGLKADGTVVAAGYNYDHECDVYDWRNIVAISANRFYTSLGLTANGTVLMQGRFKSFFDSYSYNIEDLYVPPKNISLEEYIQRRKSEFREINEKRAEEQRLREREAAKRQEEEAARIRAEKERQDEYRAAGLCQYCGGEFIGLFSKTCINCGRKKDY